MSSLALNIPDSALGIFSVKRVPEVRVVLSRTRSLEIPRWVPEFSPMLDSAVVRDGQEPFQLGIKVSLDGLFDLLLERQFFLKGAYFKKDRNFLVVIWGRNSHQMYHKKVEDLRSRCFEGLVHDVSLHLNRSYGSVPSNLLLKCDNTRLQKGRRPRVIGIRNESFVVF